jgi:hypothetical protein
MTDADAFTGKAQRRVDLPRPVPPIPTFSDERDPTVMADSDKSVEHLRSTMDRQVGSINKPSQPVQQVTTPLQEIATRIKKLVHDHGEQMGDELKAKVSDSVSMAKALQLWADDTLKVPEKKPE